MSNLPDLTPLRAALKQLHASTTELDAPIIEFAKALRALPCRVEAWIDFGAGIANTELGWTEMENGWELAYRYRVREWGVRHGTGSFSARATAQPLLQASVLGKRTAVERFPDLVQALTRAATASLP